MVDILVSRCNLMLENISKQVFIPLGSVTDGMLTLLRGCLPTEGGLPAMRVGGLLPHDMVRKQTPCRQNDRHV